MRRSLLLLWLIAPALLLAWHLNAGQRQVLQDRAATQRDQAHAAAAAGDWKTAASAAGAALATLAEAEALEAGDGTGTDKPTKPRPPSPAFAALTVDQARARIHQGELLEGIEQLGTLVDRIGADPARQDIVREARHELASASYASAWLMRLEGASADEWKPDAEQARQQFRMLAEDGGPMADAASKNVESAIRLERMDLADVQGLPLPKNCKCNAKNLSQRHRKQRESRGDNPTQQEPKKSDDARQEIKKETDAGRGNRGGGDGS